MFKETEDIKSFELVVDVKNAHGIPTGKRRSFRTDNSYKLWEFWQRNKGTRPKKKKPASAALTDGKKAEKILIDINKDTD
jgi:hypothetical protein